MLTTTLFIADGALRAVGSKCPLWSRFPSGDHLNFTSVRHLIATLLRK